MIALNNTHNRITSLHENTEKLMKLTGVLNAYVCLGMKQNKLDDERLKKDIETIIQYVLAVESDINPQ